MRAIRIEETGGPEQLKWMEVPDPEPGPSDVLVEVTAAGVNYIDTYHRTGLYPMNLPFVPGLEGAGTVIGKGTDVDGLAEGARVAWTGALGSYAERIVLPAESAVAVPESIDLDIAASVMLQGMTAHYLASDTFPLEPGHRCLVHAGAGGVGLLLIQIAKMRGAEVFTTVGSPAKAELASEAGADHVINYRDGDFAQRIREIAGDKPLDVVYDGVGQSVFIASLDLLRPRGLMVQFGNASGPVEPITPLELSRRGSLFLTRPTLFDHISTREELVERASDLFEWIAEGRLQVRIGTRYPMSEAAEAHRALEGRRTTGKVLLLAG